MPVQLPFDLPYRTSLARDDLIVTDANRTAIAAVDNWPAWSHPVLLIIGPAGAGKSHLAVAWAARAGARPLSEAHPEDLGQDFAVTIDDIDRSPLSEARIFEAVNTARLGGGFLIATARDRPTDMPIALPDLRSRLQAAATVSLGAPDDALLAGVLAKLFADRQIAFDPKWIPYVVARMERSLDAAGRLVAAIDREALASKGGISRALLQSVLASEEFSERAGKSRESG